jgi:hypothetical protein
MTWMDLVADMRMSGRVAGCPVIEGPVTEGTESGTRSATTSGIVHPSHGVGEGATRSVRSGRGRA